MKCTECGCEFAEAHDEDDVCEDCQREEAFPGWEDHWDEPEAMGPVTIG